MSKFHIGKNGPATCKATKGKCPLGGESGSENHFNSLKDAEVAFEKQNNGSLGKPLSKDKTIKVKPAGELKFSKNSASHLQYSNVNELKKVLEKINNSVNPSDADYAKDLGLNENSFALSSGYTMLHDGEGDPKHVVISYDFESNEIVIQQPIDYSAVERDDLENNHINTALEYFNSSHDNLNKLPMSNMLKNNESLKGAHLVFHEGDFYYADENEGYNIEYRYGASDDFKNNIINYSLRSRVTPLINRMNDENLPDWSALPTDVVDAEDGKPKMQSEVFERDAFVRTIEDNKKKLSNLHESANPKDAIKKTHDRINKIDEILKNNTDERSYGIIELNANQRKNYMEQRQGLLNKLSKLEAMTDEKSNQAKRVEKLFKNNIKEEQEELIIRALSNHYPSSDPKVRKAAASEWVSKHPDSVNEHTFKNLLDKVTSREIDRPITNFIY